MCTDRGQGYEGEENSACIMIPGSYESLLHIIGQNPVTDRLELAVMACVCEAVMIQKKGESACGCNTRGS